MKQLGFFYTENKEAPSVSGGNLNAILQAIDIKSSSESGPVIAKALVQDAPSLSKEPEPFQFGVDVFHRPRRDNTNLHQEIRQLEMNLNQHRLEAMIDPTPPGNLTTTANTSRVNRNAEEMHQNPKWGSLVYKLRPGTLVSKLVRGSVLSGQHRDKKEACDVSARPRVSGRHRPAVEAPSSYFQSQIRQVIDIFVHQHKEKPSFKMTVEAEPYLAAMNIPPRLWSATLRGIIEKDQIDLSQKTRLEQKAFLKQLADSKLKDCRERCQDWIEMPVLTSEEMSVYARKMKRVDVISRREETADRSMESMTVLTVHAEVHSPPPERLRETVSGPKLFAQRRMCERRPAETSDYVCIDKINVHSAAVGDSLTGDADRDNYKHLPSHDRDIRLMGDEYIDEMIDSFLTINPSLDLKIGENIFCTPQDYGDMLCFAHAAITALMNLDSIRHAASLTGGPIGEALTSFCRSATEPERHGLVRWLASQIFDNTEMPNHKAQDAAVFTRKILEQLFLEGWSGAHVFSQELEVSSRCRWCRGERKSRRLEVMSAMQEGTCDSCKRPRGCIMGELCTDGEIYGMSILNQPDAVLKVNIRRQDSKTYGENVEPSYEIRGGGGVTYSLKCCIVHIGWCPSAGHFVTVLTNPLDQEQCVLVDDGKVKRISPEQFRKFAEMSYVVGYERTDLQTMPKPSTGEVLRMIDGRHREIRRGRAIKNLAFLQSLAEEIASIEAVIDESYDPLEAKARLTRMLRKRIHTGEAEPLLKEEYLANAATEALHQRLMNYEQSRSSWGLLKRAKFFFGLYTNCDGQKLNAVSEGLVLGAGLTDKSKRLPKHAVITEKEDLHVGGTVLVYRCIHGCDIGTDMSKNEMLEHINKVHVESRRCKVLRHMDRHFKVTPRKIATGIWSNGKFRLRVVRRHDRGNKTQYAWDDGEGQTFSCVVQTASTTQLEEKHNRGQETEDGYFWPGRGYSGQKKNQLVVAKEEIMYKHVSDQYENFPVWSVLCQVYDVEGWRSEEGEPKKTQEVNLDVWLHPAMNPANLKLAMEFEITLVASEEGGPHKMVLRRPNLPDEELTKFEELSYEEETPEVDEDILRNLSDHQVRREVSKAHLPEMKGSSRDTYDADNTVFKFTNRGRLLCWVNSATQVLLRVGPNIGMQLNRVLQQSSHFSGARDLPKMLWEIAARAAEVQCLDGLRDLLAPDKRGKDGPALKFFEDLIITLCLEGIATEKLVYMPPGSCPAKGCNKTLPSSERLMKRKYLDISHKRRTDDRSSQKSIDRIFSLLEGPHPVTCSDGHTTSIRKSVTITKLPDIFWVPAECALDQESSMEVKLGGAIYEAAAVIHHIPGRTEEYVGHHYCSLKDRATGEWALVDDYQTQGWKTLYRFDMSEKAFKAKGHKLFDNLGVVFYVRRDHIGKKELPLRDDGPNFHRLTTSGQQALCATNGSNQCYAIATFAMLLSNPHIHMFFRSLPVVGATELEIFLRGLCHRPDHSVEPDIKRSRQLVFDEHERQGLKCINFTEPGQQDAEEFLHKLMDILRTKGIEDDNGVIVMEGPLSKTHRQNFLEIMGFTSRFRTTCTAPNCMKDSYGPLQHEFVLQLGICAGSVNGCIREEVGKPSPVTADQCDICGKQKVTYQRQQMEILPKKCVVIQLKRFTATNQKISTSVVVDVELAEGPFSGYRLTGAILHKGGTMEIGHYIHILRDVEDGTWVSTDDNRRNVLTENDALYLLEKEGYILLYSSPGRFPPALKAGNAAGRDVESTTRMEEPKQSRSFIGRPQNSTFKKRGTEKLVSLPRMPATANLVSRQKIVTPSAEEIAEKSETPFTTSRVIDPADPLAQLLRERFGHKDFRTQEQLAAVREIIAGVNDVMVIMSTGEQLFRMCGSLTRPFPGSGKSLIYQLAALQMNKLAIIVGPLLSLSDDQVEKLRKNGIQATLLNHQVLFTPFPIDLKIFFQRYAA